MLGRAHTVAAIACMALIPLVPLALWAYARVASADRGSTIARNAQVFRSVPHPTGARPFAASSYPLYRWDVEGKLVPVDGYRTEYFLRLRRAVPVNMIYAHYERALASWHEERDGESVQFTRGGVEIDVSTAETADGRRAREYAFYVSQ